MKSLILKNDRNQQECLRQVDWPNFENCLSNVCETLSDVLNRSYSQNDKEVYNLCLSNISKFGLNVSKDLQGKHAVMLCKKEVAQLMDTFKLVSDWIDIEWINSKDENDNPHLTPTFTFENNTYCISAFMRTHDNPWIGNNIYPEYIHAFNPNPRDESEHIFIELNGDTQVRVYQVVD